MDVKAVYSSALIRLVSFSLMIVKFVSVMDGDKYKKNQ